MINFDAFCSEYAMIKSAQAELEGNTEKRDRFLRVAKTFAKNVGAGAIGYGLGHGIGFTGTEVLRRNSRFLGTLTPAGISKARIAVRMLGGAGSIATLVAYNAAQRRIEEARNG